MQAARRAVFAVAAALAVVPSAAANATAADRYSVVAKEYMMVAAHPAAAYVGARMMALGGTALDAALAAQAMLNLVEPQSSGIGGGGFLLYWRADNRSLHSYDGRETAPAAVNPEMFFDAEGKPKPFMDVVVGGASVGVPGVLRMFEKARAEHGGLPLQLLFAPTIETARRGFPVSQRLHDMLADETHMPAGTAAAAYFFHPDGTPPATGEFLRNPQLAETLEILADQGLGAFYSGAIAQDIIAAVNNAPQNPGRMTAADMTRQQAKKRPNLCANYREYRVCGMGPPSSGGLTVLQILGMLEHTDIGRHLPLSPQAVQLFAEAMRHAFADRDLYMADADFVDVPVAGLLNPAYLQARAAQMRMDDAVKQRAEPGTPPGESAALQPGADRSPELPSTTHMTARDRYGNVLSFTSSIEMPFGSRQMVRGFLLNNQLTDFSATAMQDGRAVRNRIEPGKRPRSSMSPVIVFDADGAPRLAIGSPGGSRIIGYVARSLVAMLDWGLTPSAALALPHYLDRNNGLELEAEAAPAALEQAMAARGYRVMRPQMTSGLHAVLISEDGGLLGGVDPRREGMAYGEGNLPASLQQAFGMVLQ